MSFLLSDSSFFFWNLAFTLAIPSSVFLWASRASALSSMASVASSIAFLAEILAQFGSRLVYGAPQPVGGHWGSCSSYFGGAGLTPMIVPKIALMSDLEFLSFSWWWTTWWWWTVLWECECEWVLQLIHFSSWTLCTLYNKAANTNDFTFIFNKFIN